MISDKKYMTMKLKEALEQINFRNVVFSDNTVLIPKKVGYIRVGAPRLFFTMQGTKELLIPADHNMMTVKISTGDAMFVPANSWDRPLWKNSHEMISLTYYPTHIRILYLKHKAGQPPPPRPDVYYHSPGTLNLAGQDIVKSLDTMAETPELRLKSEYLIRPLLELTLFDLNDPRGGDDSKAYGTWCEVLHCIMENYHQPISCDFVAEELNIDPGYVSKLLKKFAGMGFSEYLTHTRMQHAETMLINSRMILDEIAFSCGYSYTSYFIRVFQKKYGCSPSQFRKRNKRTRRT